MGLGRRLVPAESGLCQKVFFSFRPEFLPVVPSSCAVKKSGSLRVQKWETKRRPHVSDRSPEDGARLLAVSTLQFLDCKIGGTKRECL
ncbi:hypothetical protein SBA2_410029 [Acidobacteriia bacterium SbA2]|nr:hypothetical protein SBA2_410029 [Acidobacteriia bacterium SbA2]